MTRTKSLELSNGMLTYTDSWDTEFQIIKADLILGARMDHGGLDLYIRDSGFTPLIKCGCGEYDFVTHAFEKIGEMIHSETKPYYQDGWVITA